MIKLLVIADDFTGALDTGAQFAKLGIPTRVACRAEFYENDAQGEGVLCLDAETRHLKPEEAHRAVYAIVKAARDAGVETLFKKVDSTLRGQIGPELAATLEAGGGGSVMFAPAYPSLGRTTVGGVHLLDGRPIHESVFGRDPFEPTTRSDIAGIIREFRDIPVINVALGEKAAACEKPRVEVYDAVTDDDLARVAKRSLQSGERLFAGCAGFAQAIAKLMAPENPISGAPIKKNGMLVVCGSLNPISDRQILRAREAGFRYLEIPARMIESEKRDEAAYAEFAHMIAGDRAKGAKVILTTPKDGVCEKGVTTRARERTARRVGDVIRAWYKMSPDDTLVVTGGDTLHAFLRDMGEGVTLEPVCELQSGVVCSVMRDTDGSRELQIISKAGGFGTDDVYIDIARQVLICEEAYQEAR